MANSNSIDRRGDLFQFFEGTIPHGFKSDFDESLFNGKAHRTLQSSNKWYSFHLLRRDKQRVLASIHFCVVDGIALSPVSAPFGSFEVSNVVTTEQLFDFIKFIEERLNKYGAEKITIKFPPEKYDVSNHNKLSVLLFNHHYHIYQAELGACLQISKQNFIDVIESWERRKLKQSLKADLNFKIIPVSRLNEIYNFILACRVERGHTLSMTYRELNTTVKKLMSHFVLFGVYQSTELVAASIAIKVNKRVLYNFYSAHSKSSDSLSPIVFLISKMYDWCGTHRFNILDLGTSAWGGKPNFPLIDFKLRLGAEPTMKLTFEKTLA
jgi:hypothetical protein